MKTNILILLSLCLFVACSSPESDGTKAAQKYCDCENIRMDNTHRVYQEFLQDFSSYNFTSRVEARDKIAELEKEIEVEYAANIKEADDFYQEISKKYLTDFEKFPQFEYAFKQYYNANIEVDDSQLSVLLNQINRQIAVIIPQPPSADKMKKDLIGRTIKEQEGGYHKYGWQWIIEEGEIKELDVIEKHSQGDKQMYKLRIVVQQPEGAAYEAVVNVTYQLLETDDDWSIEYMESLEVNIVKTGRYNNCIKHEIVAGGWLFYRNPLQLINMCDVGLQVGGRIRNGNDWEKFVINVESNETKSVNFGSYREVHEYIIDFIERP